MGEKGERSNGEQGWRKGGGEREDNQFEVTIQAMYHGAKVGGFRKLVVFEST